MKKKNKQLKDLNNLVTNLRTMFSKFLDELTVHKNGKSAAGRDNKSLR